MTDDTTRRCNATSNSRRCEFRGTTTELQDHADELEHPMCTICQIRSLRPAEDTVCEKCIQRTRDQLNEIVTVTVHQASRIIEFSGYYGMFGADLLVMTTDGSIDGGGPDDWLTDPTPVIAILEANARSWRRGFGEPPAETIATVTNCAGYLQRNLWRAGAELDEFSDFVTEISTLHSRLLHTAGLIDDPERAPAECFECGGRLIRRYQPLKSDPRQRLERIKHKVNTSAKRRLLPTSPKERREMVIAAVLGRAGEGLIDRFECPRCGTTYTWAQYGLALRTRADVCQGWVDIGLAAEVARRPERTLRTWVDRQRVSVACRVDDHRLIVWWPDVLAEMLKSKPRHAEDEQVA